MSPIAYVPHPADPEDPTMGYFAVRVRRGDEMLDLLLTDHEFRKATERAAKRVDLLPKPHEVDIGVRLYPRTWLHRLLLRFIPRTP